VISCKKVKAIAKKYEPVLKRLAEK
jgi:hypothetical protein